MTTTRHAAVGRTGNGEDLAPLFRSVRRGDQGAAALGCLDDKDTQREAGDEPVALRKCSAHRLLQWRQLAQYRPLQAYRLGQRRMFRRINVKHAASQDGDGAAAGASAPRWAAASIPRANPLTIVKPARTNPPLTARPVASRNWWRVVFPRWPGPTGLAAWYRRAGTAHREDPEFRATGPDTADPLPG